MPTRLGKPLKREIEVDGEPYTVTLDSAGVTIARKRHREGVRLQWRDVLDGASTSGRRPGRREPGILRNS